MKKVQIVVNSRTNTLNIETVQGFWIGEYNRVSQQLTYGDLFESCKSCHLEPALIIWTKYEEIPVRVSEDPITGRQKIDENFKVDDIRN